MKEGAAGLVHVVEDDKALRAALVRLIRSDGLEAVGHADAMGLDDNLGAYRPSCILLDIRLDGESGLNVQAALRERGSTTPIIFLTGFGTIPMTVQAMRAGAVEFLTKPVDDDVLLDAVRRALEMDASAVERQHAEGDLADRLMSLTDREREVMALAIGGLMNKQIAGELGTTEITAKVHKRRMMTKMRARSLPDLVRMAETLGMQAARSR
ncbi:response regulator [Sphingomonas sp. H160509]|uniref:response regulator transcription factor n=1 Tax=Sphingomonas sp. H160509 TaxID=2955313 RepID=UPI002096A2CC|nr:response regulator [Sphingomonas sp. H160509]MDD1453287.1 response regulator [Sphingomonas sp. H160509]